MDQLAAELREGVRQGSTLLRDVLSEVVQGVRSAPEAELRSLIIKAGVRDEDATKRL